MFRTVVEAVGGRATVIAGTGSNDTAHSVALTRAAEDAGVDARARRHALLQQAARARPAGALPRRRRGDELPVIIYNIPGRCVVNLSPEPLARAGRDREHRRRQAGQPRPRPARRLIELCDLGLRRQRRHAVRRPGARRLGRHLRGQPPGGRAHGRGRPARARGRPEAAQAEDAALVAAVRGAVRDREPHPGQGGAEPARATRSAACACRWWPPH